MRPFREWKIGVLGSGTMGKQIALLFAQYGYAVRVWDVGEQAVLEEKFRKCKPQLRNLIETTTVLSLLHDVDFVEECIVEDLPAKQEIFKQLGGILGGEVIIATNTSSLCVADLARGVSNPAAFCAAHFFNPVGAVRLVEVVTPVAMSEETRGSVTGLLKSLDREPVFVSDSAGFIVNRLLIPMINEAARLLESRVAAVEEIDAAMRLGARLPMGPLALADFIGLDVCLAIMKNLNSRLSGGYYTVCPLLEILVHEGRLGRKTKKGFYVY